MAFWSLLKNKKYNYKFETILQYITVNKPHIFTSMVFIKLLEKHVSTYTNYYYSKIWN